MKRRIAAGLISGIALAAVIGAAVGLNNPSSVESVSDSVLGINRSESGLPLESFAYFSIDGENSVMDGEAKVESNEVTLPLESFAYWIID